MSEKSHVISFRLKDSELEKFQAGLALSKNKSAFFKEVILSSSPEIAAKKLMAGTTEYERFNFLLYKISNNLNQIARVLNIAAKSNFTDISTFNKAVNNLNALEQLIKSKML